MHAQVTVECREDIVEQARQLVQPYLRGREKRVVFTSSLPLCGLSIKLKSVSRSKIEIEQISIFDVKLDHAGKSTCKFIQVNNI